MNAVAMIELRDVSKIYHLGDERYRALDRVRLKVRRARDLIAKSLPVDQATEKPYSH